MNPDKMPTDGQELAVYVSIRQQPVLDVMESRRLSLLEETLELDGIDLARMQGRVKELNWQIKAIESAPERLRAAQGGRK